MGNETSCEVKEEPSNRRPHSSDFYCACQAGDLNAVQTILSSSTTYTDINRVEPNGNTALHAASSFGHANIVRLLLHQHGVMRHQRNRYGLTAYEVAANDEIRRLFHRPLNSQRFSSNTTDDAQHLFTSAIEEQVEDTEVNDEMPKGLICGASDKIDVRILETTMHLTKTMARSSILQPVLKHVIHNKDDPNSVYDKNTALKALQRLIDEYVTPLHPEYEKARELISEYAKTNNVEHLLRLYSLETPFYKILGRNEKSDCLSIPLLYRLDSLKKRSYQGRSFRGLTMARQYLQIYQWALKHKGRFLSTDNFCSTSVDEDVARDFIGICSPDKVGVLMVFNFREKCNTAIQLFFLSNTLPGISDFEDEREVLILPLTIFHVTNIDIDKTTDQYTIYFENVPTKWRLFSLIKARCKLRQSDLNK